jgi:hypothetical protein
MQELYDKVVNHLRNQGVKSFAEGGCLYRSNGLSCAVGCLIEDEFYVEELEGRTVDHIDVKNAVVKSIGRDLTDQEMQLLLVLQNVHDTFEVSEWNKGFKLIAICFNLEYTYAYEEY